MTTQTTLASRIKEVDGVWEVRRRQKLLGVAAVSVAIKNADDDNTRLAALIALTNPPLARSACPRQPKRPAATIDRGAS